MRVINMLPEQKRAPYLTRLTAYANEWEISFDPAALALAQRAASDSRAATALSPRNIGNTAEGAIDDGEDASEDESLPDADGDFTMPSEAMTRLALTGATTGVTPAAIEALPEDAMISLVFRGPGEAPERATMMVPLKELLSKICGRVEQGAAAVAGADASFTRIEMPASAMRLPRDEYAEAQQAAWSQADKSALHPGKWCHWLATGGYSASRALHTQTNLSVAIHAYGRRCGHSV